MTKDLWVATLAAAALLSGACADDSGTRDTSVPDSDGVQTVEESAQGGAEHVAEGIINSVDAANNGVNISHEPVESIGWPAMTMNFQLADPSVATQLRPGQRVQFKFRTDQGSPTVTDVTLVD